jgi:hypothetical protein
MTTTSVAVRTTIFLGFICGILFYPLNKLIGYFFPSHWALGMTLWACVAAYGFFLIRWHGKHPLTLLFPVLILLYAVFAINSADVFLPLACAVLSWIRSGICFNGPIGKKLLVEIFLCLGLCFVLILLAPNSALNWALAVWLTFLVQALYFAIFDIRRDPEDNAGLDRFEQARMRADRILSSQIY